MTFLTYSQYDKFAELSTLMHKAIYLESLYINQARLIQTEDKPEATLEIDFSEDAEKFTISDITEIKSNNILSYIDRKKCICLHCDKDLFTLRQPHEKVETVHSHECQWSSVADWSWRKDTEARLSVAENLSRLINRMERCKLNDRDAIYVQKMILNVYKAFSLVLELDEVEIFEAMSDLALDVLIKFDAPKNTQLDKIKSYCEDIVATCRVEYHPYNEEEELIQEFEEYLSKSKEEKEEVFTNRGIKLVKMDDLNFVKPKITFSSDTPRQNFILIKGGAFGTTKEAPVERKKEEVISHYAEDDFEISIVIA